MNLRLPSGRVLLRRPETVIAVCMRYSDSDAAPYVQFSLLGVQYKEICKTDDEATHLAERIANMNDVLRAKCSPRPWSDGINGFEPD